MKLITDEWRGKEVYVKETFTYGPHNEPFKPKVFKKHEKYEILFNNSYTVAIEGCIFSINRKKDKHHDFFKHFYTLKEIRKEKLDKIKSK